MFVRSSLCCVCFTTISSRGSYLIFQGSSSAKIAFLITFFPVFHTSDKTNICYFDTARPYPYLVETEQFLDCSINFKKHENSRWNLSFYIFLVFLVPSHLIVGTARQRCGPCGLRQPLTLIGGTARVASGLQGPRRGAAASRGRGADRGRPSRREGRRGGRWLAAVPDSAGPEGVAGGGERRGAALLTRLRAPCGLWAHSPHLEQSIRQVDGAPAPQHAHHHRDRDHCGSPVVGRGGSRGGTSRN